MSDIHQEWRELRQKNGDFICHLDGEMAKLDKKQVELKRHEQMQHLVDAGAFAMQFVAPPPFNCCQDDRDILKALNKAQADRIKTLEDELLACKEQQQVDLAVKKDLDEKLDKAAADYKALWVENKSLKSQFASEKAQSKEKIDNAAKSYAKLAVERNNLAETVTRMEKAIRDLDERNGTLREHLAKTNVSLKRSIQTAQGFGERITYLETIRQSQAKEIKRLREIVNAPNGSCSAYTQQGMQSKIAKQANEIKRLTEENERLKRGNKALADEALDVAAKDADANFERGKIKGMQEIWKELVDCYAGRPIGENEKIFGYCSVGDILMNLSPTWFMNKAMEHHKQEEKETRDIQIGDEVEIFDQCDHSLSDTGIVTAIDFVIDENLLHFTVVGNNFGACFTEDDIDAGNVKKTGWHYDAIPLDYFA